MWTNNEDSERYQNSTPVATSTRNNQRKGHNQHALYTSCTQIIGGRQRKFASTQRVFIPKAILASVDQMKIELNIDD